MLRLAAFTALLLGPAAALGGQGDWPAFRGGGLAVVEKPTLPDSWGPERNVVWKADIAGRGWSSPVVWGDRVFVTSVASDQKPPEARKGLYIQDLNGKVPPGEHRWLVHCLDFGTGKPLWTREVHKGTPAGPVHIKNSYASETPVVDGERIYALFGNLGLFCLTHDGKQLWEKRFPAVKTRMGWGPAASPALDEGRLFLVNDNEEHSTLTALDRDGKQLWQVERDEKSNWATPFVWHNDKRTEIVTAGSKRVRSYGLDGKPLWELEGMSVISIPTPFAHDGLLYVASGYVADPFHRPVYAIRPGADGDISLKEGETANDWIVWSQKMAGPYNPTPLAHGDHLYVLYDRGLLSCFDARTGKPVYEKERVGQGSSGFTASPWAYDGKVFCLSEDGDAFVIQAGPAFKLLGKNSLDEMCLATPAPAHGSLVLRTQEHLYRFARQKQEK
jgi:outer membrane protein assembly factor BamB